MRLRTVLVIQNTPFGSAGRFGEWLRQEGMDIEVAGPHHVPVPEHLGHRALLVLGGKWLPDDDEQAPWLPAVRNLVGQALEGGNPMLGICLGGQLLAHVAGGRVDACHGTPEFGATPIQLRPEARSDPLFRALPETTYAIERHQDAITKLPPEAVWIAQSADCAHQAFRIGRRAWGVQFHPEASAAKILDWPQGPLAAHGLDPQALHARALAVEDASAADWHAFARAFADIAKEHGEADQRASA
ncbi:type 1 glutamine amidotransferase [Streptomyces sp. NPDC050738]|uniref:type 1 glutamine amidotransferase n=1 Tax=Streptomyces sp. NPDC050738 TaxID=3154744 RepID=UPI003412798A